MAKIKINPRNWYSMQMQADGEAEILIFDEIGPSFFGEDTVSAKSFVAEFKAVLEQNPSTINIRINSPGGDVADATAIFNTIQAVKDRVVVHVDGWALSAASMIAMAGRETRMADTGLLMLHNPRTFVMGEADDFQAAIDMLKKGKSALLKAYTVKSGKSEAKISALMDVTTWLTAEEASDLGLIDTVVEADGELRAVASANFERESWARQRENLPKHLAEGVVKQAAASAPARLREEGDIMPEDPKGTAAAANEPTAATLDELTVACPGASAEFLVEQMKAKATKEQAASAWMKQLTDDAEASKKEASEAKAKLEKAEAKKEPDKPGDEGISPLGVGSSASALAASGETGDAVEMFDRAVAEKMAANMSKKKAIRAVVKENSDLHRAFKASHTVMVAN